MLSEAEQIELLKELGKRLWKEESLNSAVLIRLGDTPCLQVEKCSPWEVVAATGTYDLWRDGDLTGETDLTEQQVFDRIRQIRRQLRCSPRSEPMYFGTQDC